MSSTSLCNEIPEHHTISTLDQLELGSYLWHHNSVYNFEETIREFDQFHDFLGSTLKNSLYNLDEAQKYQLILKLNELQTCLGKTLTLVSKTDAKVKGDSTFQCSYCNEVVTVNPYKEPFWKAIQSHEHFEFLLMGKLSYAIPDLHAETEQLETEAQSEVVEDFKFNFQPSYDETVENIIYPSHLLDTVFPVDNVSDYTVQNRYTSFYCLLCKLELTSNMSKVVSHINELAHQKKFTHPDCMDSLNIYHTMWIKASPIYQSHQVFFNPEDVTVMKCLLCESSVRYDDLHLHLNGDSHMRNAFKFVNELDTPSDEQKSLINLQMEIYGNFNNLLENVEGEIENPDFKETSSNVLPLTEQPISVASSVKPTGTKNNTINNMSAELQHFPEQSRPSSRCSEIITSENVSARSDNSSCEDLSDSSVYQGPNKNKMKFLMRRRITAEDPLDCAEGINSHFYETDSVPEQTTEGENVNSDVAMSDSESEANSSEVEETRNVPIEQLPEPSSTQLNRYHPDVEEHLFAWHLSQALNQDMKNSYLAARFIGKWLYCIPCGRKIDLKSWDAHCSGRRHNKRNFMLVDLFHTKCMKLPRAYQAHTLYILPDTKINVGEQRASCHICLINFSYNDLKRHIETLFHKQHFILLLMCHRKNHLMQHNLLQIQLEIFQGYEFSIMKLEKYIAGQIYYSEFRQHYLTMLGSQSGNLEMAAAITEINQKAYFCIFCRYNCQLRSWKEHLLSGGHFRKSSKNIICSPRLNCWRYVPQCFQKDRIHFMFSRKGFHCLLCRNENSTRNFQQHITGEAHMKYLFVYTVSLNYEKTNPFEIYFSNPEVSVENCGTKFDALGTYHRSSSNQHVPEPQPQIHGIYSQERSRASSRYSERSMNENTPEETVRSSFEDLTDAGVYKRPNKSQITNQGLITKETDYVSEHRVERENAVFDVATNDSEFKDVEGTRNLPMEELLGPSSTQLIRYHPDVEQHLFPVHLSQTSNQDMKCSYLAARSIGRKSYCLPCGRKMDLKSWNTHCTGKKHSNCNFTLFEIFHRKCMELPRSYQAHTLYFVPDTKSYVGEPLVLCLICVTNFTYNDFKSHIDTILHKQYFILLLMCHTDNNLMKHNLVQIQMGIFQDSELSITHLEHFVNDQICYSKFKLHYWNLLNDQSSNPEITVAVTEKNQKAYFCIFCRHNYCQLPSWKGHLNSKEHLHKLKKNIYLTRLNCWKNLPQCCQKDQIHFIFSKKNFHCLLCRKTSSINTFQQHIADEGHIYYLYVYTITMNYGRTNAFDLYMSDPNVSVENSHIKFDAVYLQDSSKQYIPGTCVNQGLFDKENESVSNKQIATDESEAEGENSSGSCEFIENIKVEEKQSPSNWQMENLPGPSTIVTELFPSNLLANLGHNFKS